MLRTMPVSRWEAPLGAEMGTRPGPSLFGILAVVLCPREASRSSYPSSALHLQFSETTCRRKCMFWPAPKWHENGIGGSRTVEQASFRSTLETGFLGQGMAGQAVVVLAPVSSYSPRPCWVIKTQYPSAWVEMEASKDRRTREAPRLVAEKNKYRYPMCCF